MNVLSENNDLNRVNESVSVYRHAILAVDAIIFRYMNGRLQVLIIQTASDSPFPGKEAFPGGLVKIDEVSDETVKRILLEKGGINQEALYIEQLGTFSSLGRDPGGRIVSTAYVGLCHKSHMESSASNPKWATVEFVRDLAYDHLDMLMLAMKRLESWIKETTAATYLLPEEFSLSDLEGLYENVLNKPFDKRNFRKRLLKFHLVTPVGKKRYGGSHRPAELYKFTEKGIRVEKMC